MLKQLCIHLDLCPWKVQPVVGMWARREEVEFWGTDCLLYRTCPHVTYGRINNAGNTDEDMAQLDKSLK